MEIEVVRKEKNFVEFTIKGERHTFPNLLRSRLLLDADVEFASYVLDHPLDESARFALRTKGKAPKKALEEAIKKIEDDLSDFDKSVQKALK